MSHMTLKYTRRNNSQKIEEHRRLYQKYLRQGINFSEYHLGYSKIDTMRMANVLSYLEQGYKWSIQLVIMSCIPLHRKDAYLKIRNTHTDKALLKYGDGSEESFRLVEIISGYGLHIDMVDTMASKIYFDTHKYFLRKLRLLLAGYVDCGYLVDKPSQLGVEEVYRDILVYKYDAKKELSDVYYNHRYSRTYELFSLYTLVEVMLAKGVDTKVLSMEFLDELDSILLDRIIVLLKTKEEVAFFFQLGYTPKELITVLENLRDEAEDKYYNYIFELADIYD